MKFANDTIEKLKEAARKLKEYFGGVTVAAALMLLLALFTVTATAQPITGTVTNLMGIARGQTVGDVGLWPSQTNTIAVSSTFTPAATVSVTNISTNAAVGPNITNIYTLGTIIDLGGCTNMSVMAGCASNTTTSASTTNNVFFNFAVSLDGTNFTASNGVWQLPLLVNAINTPLTANTNFNVSSWRFVKLLSIYNPDGTNALNGAYVQYYFH